MINVPLEHYRQSKAITAINLSNNLFLMFYSFANRISFVPLLCGFHSSSVDWLPLSRLPLSFLPHSFSGPHLFVPIELIVLHFNRKPWFVFLQKLKIEYSNNVRRWVTTSDGWICWNYNTELCESRLFLDTIININYNILVIVLRCSLLENNRPYAHTIRAKWSQKYGGYVIGTVIDSHRGTLCNVNL